MFLCCRVVLKTTVKKAKQWRWLTSAFISYNPLLQWSRHCPPDGDIHQFNGEHPRGTAWCRQWEEMRERERQGERLSGERESKGCTTWPGVTDCVCMRHVMSCIMSECVFVYVYIARCTCEQMCVFETVQCSLAEVLGVAWGRLGGQGQGELTESLRVVPELIVCEVPGGPEQRRGQGGSAVLCVSGALWFPQCHAGFRCVSTFRTSGL